MINTFFSIDKVFERFIKCVKSIILTYKNTIRSEFYYQIGVYNLRIFTKVNRAKLIF